MKWLTVTNSTRITLLLCLGAAVIGVPVGLAIADGGERAGPDTNPVLDRAGVSAEPGPDAATPELMSVEEARAASSYPDPSAVPANTEVYIAPGQAAEDLIESCRRRLAEVPEDQLCRLYILQSEGKARSGAYSAAQAQTNIEEADARGATQEVSK